MESEEIQRLAQRILQRSHTYTTDPKAPFRHHLVPRSYLERWTVGGQLRRTLVDTGRRLDRGLKGVGWLEDFYRLDAEDLDPARTPPLFGEVLLGELENIAKPRIDTLLSYEPGPVQNDELIVEMSLYIAAQYVRGKAFRDEHLVLIDWSDRQDQVELTTRLARVLLTARAGGTPPVEAAVERAAAEIRKRTPISSDHKAQAIELMLAMWLNLTPLIANWKWALYRSESPLLTSDEPVTLIGRPGTDRGEKPGLVHCAAIVFPLSPDRLLALFPPASDEPRYPYVLTPDEARQINAELMAFADSAVFEQPGAGIAESIMVPARGQGKPLLDPAGNPAQRYRKPSRWAQLPTPPPPPVARWHQPENWWAPSSGIGCQVLNCGRGAEMPIRLPEVVEHVRANPFAFDSDPDSPVCRSHHAQLHNALAKSLPAYTVDLRWRNPQNNRRERRIIFPVQPITHVGDEDTDQESEVQSPSGHRPESAPGTPI